MPSDEQIEVILGQYRPAPPSAELRHRILNAAIAQSPKPIFRWLAVAAVLAACLTLDLATQAVKQQTASILGYTKYQWTPQAEEMVALIGNDTSARDFIAMRLATSDFSSFSLIRPAIPQTSGELQ